MRKVDLDFVASRKWSGTGLALLAAGLLAAVAASYASFELERETEAWEAKVADLRRLGDRRMKRVDAGLADTRGLAVEVRGANAILAQMSVPWNELFRELEAAAGQSVALLSVQPDAAGRQVRISGEAKNMQAALDYVAKLERGGTLRRVVLTSHDTKQSGTQRPVAFSLSADWAIAS